MAIPQSGDDGYTNGASTPSKTEWPPSCYSPRQLAASWSGMRKHYAPTAQRMQPRQRCTPGIYVASISTQYSSDGQPVRGYPGHDSRSDNSNAVGDIKRGR